MSLKSPVRGRAGIALGLAAGSWVGFAPAALAHGGDALTRKTLWTAWSLTPEIVLLTLLVLAVYLRGMARRKLVRQPPSRLRHGLFLVGVVAVFLALQSPVDAMAERLFSMHQVQHILLRMVGPMLIMVAAPQGVLVAGLPRVLRRRVLAPVVSSGALRAVFAVLTRPVVAFGVFVASLYVWQVPGIHNAALLNPAIHYLMHVSMLAAGLLFWWLIFDRRESAAAIAYPVRLLMLVAVIVSNILIGSISTLKEVVVYSAYDIGGRLFGANALADESMGGYLIWVPGSMMTLIAILIVMHGWGRQEERQLARRNGWSGSNSAALEFPQTAEELRLKVQRPNRTAALTLAAASVGMFVITMTTAVVITVMF